MSNKGVSIDDINKKCSWVRKETLMIHKYAQGIRIASALSCVEILSTLYYGKIINYDPKDVFADSRDRFIISKAHGVVSFYPILADLGFFGLDKLSKVGKECSILGDIPDCSIPGFETINGSLGHGLGVASGMALALRKKGKGNSVFVLSGDGELNEGSVWEGIMFAGHHKLDNLILIIDNNRICMLDYCRKIIDIGCLDEKFTMFGWDAVSVDGHEVKALYETISDLKKKKEGKPKVVIANTIKGKSVRSLETDSLCHIKALRPDNIDALIKEM